MPESWRSKWKRRAHELTRETHAIYLACRDSRTPWYAKAVAACVVAYALSPIDLIPDPIPVLGYLDDFALLPLGVALVRRLIPADVLDECRRRTDERAVVVNSLGGRIAAGVIVVVWLIVIFALVRLFWQCGVRQPRASN